MDPTTQEIKEAINVVMTTPKIPTYPQEDNTPIIGKKNRGWSITINNPTQADVNNLIGDPAKPDFQYLIFQFERGENGTLHIQGFIYYKSQRVWPKKKFPNAHIEPAKSIKALIAYCSKEESRVDGPYEYGEKPEQGKRTDLEDLAKLVMDPNVSMTKFAEDHPAEYVKYHRGLQALRTQVAKPRTTAPKVYWFWGTSGAGKTRAARALASNPDSYYIKDASPWWDKYANEEVIIIDDFDEAKFPYRELLRLLDFCKFQGQIKGGYTEITSPIIAITCEYPPNHLWTDNAYVQIERRLDEIIQVVPPPTRNVRTAVHKIFTYDEDGNITVTNTEQPPIPTATSGHPYTLQ